MVTGFRATGRVATVRALIAARKSNAVDSETGEGIGLDTQDEYARQFCERLTWEVVGAARDTISGRLAPIDRPDLGSWLGDPAKLALFDVVVAYRADRLSRGEDTDWSRIETWAADHGKTLVLVDSSTGIRYPARDDSDRWQWMSAKTQAGKEWNDIRERIIRSQCRIMRDGFWVGQAPWGYQIVGSKYRKSLVADAKLADYIKAVYDRAIEGQSLRDIAAWLTGEGVPTERGMKVWHEGVVRNILGNETYTGVNVRKCAECGSSHNLAVPVLVDMATQRRALNALKSRYTKSVNGGRPSAEPAMLVPACMGCGVQMYRDKPGGSYWCKPRTVNGERKGCNLRVRCDMADKRADAIISADREPEIVTTITYPAAALESEIEKIRRQERAAFELDDYEKMTELRGQRQALEAELATTDRERAVSMPTGRTIGECWTELNPSERRAWIKKLGFKVELSATGIRVRYPWREV